MSTKRIEEVDENATPFVFNNRDIILNKYYVIMIKVIS